MDSIVEYSIHNHMIRLHATSIFFFFNDTATTEIYTLSLHDALPISGVRGLVMVCFTLPSFGVVFKVIRDRFPHPKTDRKSTRLNSSHLVISYAVFCLKKKKEPAAIPRCSNFTCFT